MRVKLSVVNTEREAPPRTYVFEQDTVVIGRAGTCDLPLDDPNRVVSKRHSELRVEGDALRVFDMGSKNHTFLDGARIGTSGSPVTDGNKIQLGPFEIVVEIDRDRLVADDLDRTVFGAAFANPFEDQATALAAALSEVRRVYQTLDYDHRDAALEDALRDHLGADATPLAAIVSPTAAPPSDP
ncbi:FHA domain-containing protein, partial [Rubrivirga sp.]|uniref:FHA domain-containing protein n=1 Tax=Rubrivirga sp. TaxID=1885344 RepID=UPI003C78AC7B